MSISVQEKKVCDFIAARDAEMRADLARHVAIPTGHNFGAGLDEYRGIMTERLSALGARIELVPGEAKPNWLRTPTPGQPQGGASGANTSNGSIPPTAIARHTRVKGSSVLLVGHLDTVFDPRGAFRTLAVSTDGRTAIGPGVVDMKGGILIAVVALEALKDAGIDFSWTFALNSDEETGSYSSERALRAEASKHDVGLVFEPALPDGSLVIERKGSGQFKIEIVGKSAHVGREFEKGISAVYALGEVLSKLSRMSDVGRGIIVNVGPIEGGQATNVVPDHAAAWGNVRYSNRQTADDLAKRMDALSSGPGTVPMITVKRSFNRPAKPQTPAVQKLALAARTVAEELGQRLPFASTGGVCDGNTLQDAGLATIDTLGVRGGGLHTHQEWIELDSLVQRAQMLAVLMARLADGSALAGGLGALPQRSAV